MTKTKKQLPALNRLFSTGFPVLLFFTLSAAFAGCSDDDEEEVVKDDMEEVLNVITNSLKIESNGLAASISIATAHASAQGIFDFKDSVQCGKSYQDTIQAIADYDDHSYDYFVDRMYEVGCDSFGNPTLFNYAFTMAGTNDGIRVYIDEAVKSDWMFTQLHKTHEATLLNGTYRSFGKREFKTGEKGITNVEISYTLQDIAVNKSSYEIDSGTAQVSYNEENERGNRYNYTGVITFNGKGKATLVINGNPYVIEL